MPAGVARIEITFLVDADGILQVSAREETTGIESFIEVKPSYGLTNEEVEKMLLDSFENAEEDVQQRNLRVARVEGERMLLAMHAAMDTDEKLLSAEERMNIEAVLKELRAVIARDDHKAIRTVTEELDMIARPFAERRMNRAVGMAVHGRSISEVEER